MVEYSSGEAYDPDNNLRSQPCHEEFLPEGATLAPVIIATDKMQLTQYSGNKTAYPVYMTLGNLPCSLYQHPF